jgi:hypothetical protein
VRPTPSRCSMHFAARGPPWTELRGVARVRSRHRLRLGKAIRAMHEIIYLIGLVVVVMFILGLLGVR